MLAWGDEKAVWSRVQAHLDAGQQVWLVTATPYELAATIAEALAIKRHHVAGTMYLFGNMKGQKY